MVQRYCVRTTITDARLLSSLLLRMRGLLSFLFSAEAQHTIMFPFVCSRATALAFASLFSFSANSAETLWKKHTVHESAQCLTAIAADFTKDGLPDIIANSAEKTRLFVAPDWKEIILDATPSHDFIHAETIDIDADGNLDFIAARYQPGLIIWLEQPPKPLTDPWPLRVISKDLNGIHGLLTGDIDNDGRIDLIANSAQPTDTPYPESLLWLPIPKDLRSAKNWQAHPFADKDAPGLTHYLGFGEAWWFENDGKGKFSNHLVARDQEAYDIRAFDINQDGALDLLIAGRGSKNVAWYENPNQPKEK
jgi:hypothetical protein